MVRSPGTLRIKPPASSRGLLLKQQVLSLPADQEAGSTTRAAANGALSTVAVGNHLDPQRILVLEVRGVAGLAQRIQAGLLHTRGRGGEPPQLEDHPRAGIHFRQGEVQGRSFGGHLDLGTGSDVARVEAVVPAIATEGDWRLGGPLPAPGATVMGTTAPGPP